MTTKSIILTIAIALGASLLLAAGGYFWLQPALTPDLPKAVMPTVDRAAALQAETSLHFTTLEQVQRAPRFTDFQPRPVVRNPFIWPDEMARLQAAAAGVTLAEAAPGRRGIGVPDQLVEQFEMPPLKMILIGDQQRLAMIGRQVVREGDVIMDHRVKTIRQGEVVMADPDRREIRMTMVEPPRFIAAREAVPAGGAKAAGPRAVPREDASDGEKMRYLMQEMQQTQGLD